VGTGTVKIIGLPSTRGRQKVRTYGKDYESVDCTVVLCLSGLTGTASHPVMQKIRKIRFYLKIGYIGTHPPHIPLFPPTLASMSLTYYADT